MFCFSTRLELTVTITCNAGVLLESMSAIVRLAAMLDLDKSGWGAFDSLAKNTLALQARVTMVTLLNLRSLDSSLTYEQVLKFRSIFVAKRKRWRTCVV